MGSDLTVELTQSLAATRGVKPTEVRETLHEYIDLEALEELARHEGGPWQLSFELPEHTVTVTSDNRVTVNGGDHSVRTGSADGNATERKSNCDDD